MVPTATPAEIQQKLQPTTDKTADGAATNNKSAASDQASPSAVTSASTPPSSKGSGSAGISTTGESPPVTENHEIFTDLQMPNEDKKRHALEMRLRTVRDIIKHQSEANEQLMKFCDEASRWMGEADEALRRNDIVLYTRPPKPFHSKVLFNEASKASYHYTPDTPAIPNPPPMLSNMGGDMIPLINGGKTDKIESPRSRSAMSDVHPVGPNRIMRMLNQASTEIHPPKFHQEIQNDMYKSPPISRTAMSESNIPAVPPGMPHFERGRMDWECDSENEDLMGFRPYRQPIVGNFGMPHYNPSMQYNYGYNRPMWSTNVRGGPHGWRGGMNAPNRPMQYKAQPLKFQKRTEMPKRTDQVTSDALVAQQSVNVATEKQEKNEA